MHDRARDDDPHLLDDGDVKEIILIQRLAGERYRENIEPNVVSRAVEAVAARAASSNSSGSSSYSSCFNFDTMAITHGWACLWRGAFSKFLQRQTGPPRAATLAALMEAHISIEGVLACLLQEI